MGTVVISMLGTTLDAGRGPARWEKWRPTVAMCQREDFLVDRLELLTPPRFRPLAEQVVADIAQVSPETEVVIHDAPMVDPWDLEEVFEKLLAFARGYRFEVDEHDYLVHITTGTHIAQICLFLLTESRYFPARLLETHPPKQGSPTGSVQVIDLDLSKYDRVLARFEAESRDNRSLLKGGIDTRNAAFNRLIAELEHVATASRAPILLMGPTGAGKSALARRIYELRRARHLVGGPFVEVNCATLRGDGAMSALFGHAKGAFTGAVTARVGLLKEAHGGLLFLDEIGELGSDEQAMLLRAIEEKRFRPLGADREEESEFSLIAGTNKDLHERVADGGFREDLLARIDLWTFRLPGLAERREDLEPNLDYELERAGRALGLRVSISKEARARFLEFAHARTSTWRGNFRDLNAAVTRMSTLAAGGRITEAVVDAEVERLGRAWSAGRRPEPIGRSAGLVERVLGARATELDRFDRVQLEDVLSVCAEASSLSAAGRVLFAASRQRKSSQNDADRLRKYLARFELGFAEVQALLGAGGAG